MTTKPIVMILGGSGFIGRHIAADFLERGWRVLIITRDPDAARTVLGTTCEYAVSPRVVDPSMSPRIIINLAGASVGDERWTAKRKQTLIDSRLGPTSELADWIANLPWKPWLVIQASAVGYYGNGSARGWPECDEQSPPQDIFVSQLCQQWEALARQMQQDTGVPVAILRLGVVLGRHGGILPQLLRPVSMGVGKIGSGAQPLTWVHMDDVLGVVQHLAGKATAPGAKAGEHGNAGSGTDTGTDAGQKSPAADAGKVSPAAGADLAIYNLTAPERTTQLQFAQTAARLMKRPLLLGMPAGVMRMMMGEQADLVLDGQFVKPARLLADGYAFRFATLQSALEDLVP